MEKSEQNNDSQSLVSFLIIECVALVAFCLGGINVIFHYAGFIIALFGIFTTYKKIDKFEIKSLILVLVPILIIAVTCAFGNLNNQSENIPANIGLFLGIISFFAMGLIARRANNVSISTILISIGCGMALLVLICMITTWIQYGFFYIQRFASTPAYYYDGKLYDITTEMSWLNGFKINEVSTKYGGLFGVMLCSAFPALLFISPKKNTKKFIVVSVIGGVGLLSILTGLNVIALIFLVPMILVSLIYRFIVNEKIKKYGFKTLKVLFIVCCLLFVFVFVVALVPSLQNSLSSVPVIGRIFVNNRIARSFYEVIGAAFKPYNLFGFPQYPGAADVEGTNRTIILNNYGIFELEIVKEGGIFAFFSLIALIIIFVFSIPLYLKKSKDSKAIKVVALCFLITFFIYNSFNWDNNPFTHQGNILFFTRSFPALILFFALGLFYFPFCKEDPQFNNTNLIKSYSKNNDKVKYEDDDYVFTDIKSNEVVEENKNE